MPRPPRRQQLRQRQQKVSCKAAPLWRSLLSSRSGGRAKHGRVLADLDPLGRRAPRRLQLGRRGALARRALEPFLAQPLLASPVAGGLAVAGLADVLLEALTAPLKSPFSGRVAADTLPLYVVRPGSSSSGMYAKPSVQDASQTSMAVLVNLNRQHRACLLVGPAEIPK